MNPGEELHHVEGGEIVFNGRPVIERPFEARSKHTGQREAFYSKSGAAFWLWAISKRFSDKQVEGLA